MGEPCNGAPRALLCNDSIPGRMGPKAIWGHDVSLLARELEGRLIHAWSDMASLDLLSGDRRGDLLNSRQVLPFALLGSANSRGGALLF